jgi:selenocysteine-specific elongation factor
MDKEELRQRCGFAHGTQAFNAMLEALSRHRAVFVRGNRVRTGSDSLELDRDTEARLGELSREVERRGAAFPAAREVAGAWRGSERFEDALQLLKDRGDLIGVGEGGVIHRDALAACLEALKGLFHAHGSVAVGDVKDALGLSRKHAIPILEWLDAAGMTVRDGNRRLRGPRFPD